MITTREKATVGAFVVAVTVLTGAALAALWGVNATKPVKRYYVLFDESVAGLLPGSPVNFNGLAVGKVERMGIDTGGSETIRVDIEVDPKTPVKVDTQAQLVGQGLTGVRYLELIPHKDDRASPALDPANPIAVRPSQWTDMVERLTRLSEAVSHLLDEQNRAEIAKALKNANKFLETGTASVASTSAALSRVTTRVEKILDDERAPIQETVDHARSTLAKIDRLVDEQKMQGAIDDLVATAKEARSALKQIDTTLAQANVAGAVADVRSTAVAAANAADALRGLAPRLEDDLERTARLLEDARRAARGLDELVGEVRDRPSLLLRDYERPRRSIPDKP